MGLIRVEQAPQVLKLDHWQDWTVPAEMRVAQAIEAEPNAVCKALVAEVAGHCADLERDFALGEMRRAQTGR